MNNSNYENGISKFNIFDYIDEIIYISDIQTDEIVYCNKFAKEKLGYNYAEKKCFEYFRKSDVECDACGKSELLKFNKRVWFYRDIDLNENYMIHDCILVINNRKYKLELAVNVSCIEKDNEAVRYSLDLERKLEKCIRRLVNSESFDESIHYVLNVILNFYKGERSYVFNYDWEKDKCNNMYVANKEDTSSDLKVLNDIPINIGCEWNDFFADKEEIIIKDVSELKKEGKIKEFHFFSEYDIKSFIAAPILYKGKIKGFVAVDNPENFEKIEFLKDIAYFMSNEMQKNEYVEDLKRISYYDSLCKTKNRNAYEKKVRKIESEKHSFKAVVFVDMNGLKFLNDNLGHEYGDKEIQRLSGVLCKHFDIENVYRISGDEFVILDMDISYEDFKKKCLVLKNELYKEQDNLASMGFIWDDNDLPMHILEHQAEQLMYADKQKYYLTNGKKDRKSRPEYIKRLLDNLKNDNYVVYYQPEYSVKENKIYGAEALVRKIDEDGNVIFPHEFIKVLEKENMISFVDYFVFEKVCNYIKELEDMGINDIIISSNFSMITISENEFVENIIDICKRTGANPKRIIIEITEASGTVHVQKLTDIMQSLKKLGIRFALDDMGTEYSTLEMLEINDVEIVKFDVSLVKRVEIGNRGQLVLKKLIELCHTLGMECIAEGVENFEQLEALRQISCDKIQGYLFGRPVPKDEFTRFIHH